MTKGRPVVKMKDIPETAPKCRQPFKNGLPESDIDSGRAELIYQLKTWHSSQTHLPPLTDEHFHLFLHSCYDSVEKTKKTIEAYFTFRTESKDLFSNRDSLNPEIQDFLNISNMVQLTRNTPEGYKVLIYRLTDMDPLKLFFLPSIKAFLMFNDMVLSDNGLKPGYVVIFDMKDHTLGHLARITLPLIRKLMYYIQECHPVRLKGVHIINSVPFMDKVLMLLKPFMKSEMIKMSALVSFLHTCTGHATHPLDRSTVHIL
uniref:CRAL-TRIO domain-containing protein n=1 Tax=Timema shepardi TaxID=629360 RepID=A0A7R9G5R6_TIMSH|nr:unnamed protein product [Timema shepardi]